MDTVEIVILLIALIFIIALFIIVYVLIKFFRNQSQNNKHYSRKLQPLKIGNRLNQNSSINQLESKLLTMLQGDVTTAKRLYRLTKTNNPTESKEWCLEKTIFDLERDRRY